MSHKGAKQRFLTNARIVLCLTRVKRVFHVFFYTAASLHSMTRFFMSSEEPYPPAAPRRPVDLVGRTSIPARTFLNTASVCRERSSKMRRLPASVRRSYRKYPKKGYRCMCTKIPLFSCVCTRSNVLFHISFYTVGRRERNYHAGGRTGDRLSCLLMKGMRKKTGID